MPNQSQAKVTRDALHADERARLAKVETAFRVQAAALHGDNLSELMVNTLANGLTSNPAIFHHVVTGSVAEFDPNDSKSMRALTRDIINNDELAMRNIEFSLGHRKAVLEAEFLSTLRPSEALNLTRKGPGVLEKKMAEYVSERLDERYV